MKHIFDDGGHGLFLIVGISIRFDIDGGCWVEEECGCHEAG